MKKYQLGWRYVDMHFIHNNIYEDCELSFDKHNFYSIFTQNKFGDQYKLFLLVNPEDDKPVAVVVPTKTLQPETTGDCLTFT